MRKKNELYETEQIEIINQLIAILQLDAYDSITLYELENDLGKTCKRLWNRDTNASLNINKICQEAIAGRNRPEYLKRSRQTSQ